MIMITDVLKFGINSGEFQIVNIKTYAEFFIDTLRDIRRGALADYSDGEMLQVPPKQSLQLKTHSRMFAEFFIKGITSKGII
jgi:hypothetical protein